MQADDVFVKELRSLHGYERYVRVRKEVYDIYILPRASCTSANEYNEYLETAESIVSDLYQGVRERERVEQLRTYERANESAIARERTLRSQARRRALESLGAPRQNITGASQKNIGSVTLNIPALRIPREVLDEFNRAESDYFANDICTNIPCGLRDVTASVRQREELLNAFATSRLVVAAAAPPPASPTYM